MVLSLAFELTLITFLRMMCRWLQTRGENVSVAVGPVETLPAITATLKDTILVGFLRESDEVGEALKATWRNNILVPLPLLRMLLPQPLGPSPCTSCSCSER